MQSSISEQRIPQRIEISKPSSSYPMQPMHPMDSLLSLMNPIERDFDISFNDSTSEMRIDISESSSCNEDRFSNSSKDTSSPRKPSRRFCEDMNVIAARSPSSTEPQRRSVTRSKAFRVIHRFVSPCKSPCKSGNTSLVSLSNKSACSKSTYLETLDETTESRRSFLSFDDELSKEDSVTIRKAQIEPLQCSSPRVLSPRRTIGEVFLNESISSMSMLSLASIPEKTGDHVEYLPMGTDIRLTKSSDCSIDSNSSRSRSSSSRGSDKASRSNSPKRLSDHFEHTKSDSEDSIEYLSDSISTFATDFGLVSPVVTRRRRSTKGYISNLEDWSFRD